MLDAEELEQLVVPLAGRQIEQHRPRGIRHVRDVSRAAGQLPDEPRVDRPEYELALRKVRPPEDPLELRRREVRIRHEAGPLPDQVGRQLRAPLGSAAVLPHDGAVDRAARASLPDKRRLALVCDPDPGELMRAHARVCQSVRGGAFHSRPDLIRIVLHPAGLRKLLLERAVTAPDGAERLVDNETRRARRALVDRENHSRPNGNATSCIEPVDGGGGNRTRVRSRTG